MSKLRDAINYPVDVLEQSVEIDGETYAFKGTANASLYADTMLLPEAKCKQLAEHWARVAGQYVSLELVKHILIVSYTLQPPTGEEDKPYDVTDIAAFAVKKGPKFMEMVNAAYAVSGLSADKESLTPFEQVAKGNSAPQEPTS